MKKLSSVLSVIFVFVLASVLVFCNMSYVKADNEKAAAGVRYETINIDSESLTGNAIWGLTEGYSNVAMDDSAYFYADSSGRQSGGMPVDGKVTMQSGVPYQLVSGEKDKAYDGNDCIRLTPSNKTASINLETIGVYDEIYVLATAGGPGTGNYAKFTVTLTYTDGTTSSTEYRLYDWFDTTNVGGVEKYTSFRRINISGGSYDGSTTAGPILHSATIKVNSSKLLKSVSFITDGKTYSSNTGSASTSSIYCCIFAVTGATPAGVPDAPVATAATDNVKNISGGSYFTANWNSVSGATGYYLDVATDRNFTQMVSGYNNVSVGNVTNYKVTGLNADTTYYYRVRAYNNSGQSLSSNRVATGLPIWATDAGITEDGAAYDAENGILTVNSSVQLKKSLVIPSGETTTITLVNKAEIIAPTGNSAITASGKDTGLIVNGEGTIKGGAGNDGSSGASGSAAIDMSGASGDSTVKVEGNTTIVGGNGGDATSNNGQGGNGGDAIKGNDLVKIDIAGGTSGTTSIIGGNGGAGKGSASGGAGGAGISSSNSIVTVGGNGSTSSDAQIIGGNGGNSESGNGGAGGTGVNGSKVTVNEGNITGGNGGNAGGNGTGGTGGTGVNGGNNITVNTGSNVTGGNGGNAESGTGGTGGKGVNGSTTSNSGTTTGGNGGNSQTGNVGNGGNAGTTTGTSGTSGKKIDLSVEIESFNSIEQGSDADEKTLKISNSLNSMVDATITSVKLESGEVFSISGSVDGPVTINKGTSNSTWKVKVKSGLKANADGTACTYTDTIIVTYDNGAVARKGITITVNPLMYTLDVIGGKVESCLGVSSGNKYAVGSTITVVADSPKTEYGFVGWSGIESESAILIFEMPEKDLSIKAEYKDIINPTGTIELTGIDFKWNNLITDIKFNIFYKEYKTVSINANDNGSGVDSIYYYISKEALSEEDLKADTIDWIAYDNKFIINNNQKYVIYAKITDRAGNVTYISSDGLVIDTIKPIINGIEDNGTYCEDKNFTISDENINSITIAKDGEEAKEITLNDSYTISASEKGEYLITVSDKAGNITTITIYMVEHKYSSQVIAPTVLDKGYTKYTCDRCNHEYMDYYVDALGVEGLHSYDENELNEIKAELTRRLQDEQNPPSESEKELYNTVDGSINKMLSDIDEAKKLIDKLNDIERKLSDVTEISIKNKEDIETSIITIDDLINKYSKSLTEDKKVELLSTKKKLEDMLKEAIEKDVDNKISDAEEISAGLVDLTDEEITKLNEKIKSIKEELNKEIANAKDKNRINDIYTKALQEIANEIDLAMNTDLSHAKDKAKNEIDKKAENEKLAIDNLDELTDIEKAQAKADIDAKAKSAKEALDLITDVSEKNQINEKLSEVNDAIDNIANKEENRNEGIKNAEAVWTDSDGYIHYGNLADMIEEAPADSIIAVKNNVEIDKNISIGSGKTIFVPDNKKVTIKDGAIVEIEKGASITNNGTIEINSEAKLNNNGKFSNATTGTVTNAGSLNNNEGGKVDNKGAVENTGSLNNNTGSTFDNTGSISNTETGTVTNAGNLNNNESGKLENTGVLNNTEGGKLDNAGSLTNNGEIRNNDGANINNSGAFNNSGNIVNNGTVSNAGDISNSESASIIGAGDISNAGTINNAGNITVNGNVTGDGNISGSGSVQEKVTTIVVSEDNDTAIEDSVSADVGDGNVTIIIDSLDENKTTDGNIITRIKISSVYNFIKSATGDDGMLLIKNGSDIMLRLSVIKKNGNVTEDVKKVMENATENSSVTGKKLVIGEYVDLIYEMKKNKEAWTKLSELQNEIEITIAVPDELKGKNVYYILRNHDGVCDMLMDLDDDPDTITFRTDRFSTYAIVYEEEPQVQESVETGDKGMVNALEYMLMACLALASMGIILKKKSYAK